MRRGLVVIGAILGGLGFLAGVGAVALPWARYQVRAASVDQAGGISLLDLDQGEWYLLLLFVTLGAVGAAIGARTWLRLVAPLVGAVAGVAGTVLAIAMVDRVNEAARLRSIQAFLLIDVEVDVGPAVGPALVAPLLLGTAAVLLSTARARTGPHSAEAGSQA